MNDIEKALVNNLNRLIEENNELKIIIKETKDKLECYNHSYPKKLKENKELKKKLYHYQYLIKRNELLEFKNKELEQENLKMLESFHSRYISLEQILKELADKYLIKE